MPDAPQPHPHACLVGRMTGVGLDRDAALLRTRLEHAGFETSWTHPRGLPLLDHLPLPRQPRHDLLIFLERVFLSWHRTAAASVLIAARNLLLTGGP